MVRLRLIVQRVYDDGTTLQWELEAEGITTENVQEKGIEMGDTLMDLATMFEHQEDVRENPVLDHSYDPEEGDPDISKPRRFGYLADPNEA